MEDTLGKRIVANRKRLGITQDRLAEQLGVTAQAVSKWENDQSCPDITLLPKLAEVFGISVDALLGLTPQETEKVYEAEIVTEPDSTEESGNKWEFHYDAGRRGSIWFAVWVLLLGAIMLLGILWDLNLGFWGICWQSALFVFGLQGLYPKFSFFNLGCALFGGYFLAESLTRSSIGLSAELVLPMLVILFGLSLLMDAVRKPNKHRFSVTHNGRDISKQTSRSTLGEDTFDSSVSFGEETHRIDLPRLRSGSASVSFGELTVDLSGCETVAPGCRIEADCSFGELTIRVPMRYRVELNSSTAFASVEVNGRPHPESVETILLDANASFGQISVDYI